MCVITKFGWNLWENDKIMLVQSRQPAFLSVRASCTANWMWTGSLRRLSGPQALQIWTFWTATSGAPCWRSIINSSGSIRQLMSWKSLCRPFRKRCHKKVNKAVAIFTKCLQWLWLSMVVTSSIVTVRLQVCILISSPTNWLFSETPTDYPWRLCSECWEMGVVLVEIA